MGNDLKNQPLSTRVLHLADLAGDDLKPLGIAALPDRPVVMSSPTAKWDLVLLRLVDDPMFERGQLGIPRRQREHLRVLDKRGVSFDDLLIAHEVPKASLAASPEIQSARAAVERESTRHADDLAATVGGISKVGRGVAIGALTLTALPLALLAPFTLADPILIGALTTDGSPTPGALAAYFEIIRWT